MAGITESHTVTLTGLLQLSPEPGAAAGHIFTVTRKELQAAAEVGWACYWCKPIQPHQKMQSEDGFAGAIRGKAVIYVADMEFLRWCFFLHTHVLELTRG